MWTWAYLLPLLLFSITMTATPGPNNVMLTASGALYGYRRTLPHIAGILVGCFILFASIGLGLGVIFERYPLVQQVLRLVGAGYLLYLAWRIATAPPPSFTAVTDARPLTGWQAALFQFANPKAWVMGLTLTSSFLPEHGVLWVNAIALALIMELVAFPCVSLWAGFGMVIATRLNSDMAWRRFNRIMGAMTAACVFFILA